MVPEERKGIEVSVIMPAYNSEKTIGQAIESVLRQNIGLELIIIDDGSTDHTESIVKKYRTQDERVKYIKNVKNLGAAASRNKGITQAEGNYIAFLDADDWWVDGKLIQQMEILDRTQAVLCCTARNLVSQDGKSRNHIIHVKPEITYHDLLFHNSINCSSVVVKKEAIQKYPMEHEDSHEDYISWLKILKEYGTAYGIDEPLLQYRLSENSKSGSKLKSAKMTFKVYRYMGFGWLPSIGMFVSYAFHGLKKYVLKG